MWKCSYANAHFVRTIWCSFRFYLVWERRSHPLVYRTRTVTITKASMMARSVSWMWPWALWHKRGAQYSAFERTRAKVPVCMLVARSPQPDPTSRLKGTTRDVDFWEVTRGVGDAWATCPKYFRGLWVRIRRTAFRCCGWLSLHV